MWGCPGRLFPRNQQLRKIRDYRLYFMVTIISGNYHDLHTKVHSVYWFLSIILEANEKGLLFSGRSFQFKAFFRLKSEIRDQQSKFIFHLDRKLV